MADTRPLLPSFSRSLDQAVAFVATHGGEAASTLIETLAANPMGATVCAAYVGLAAAAVALLVAHLRKGDIMCPSHWVHALAYTAISLDKLVP